MLVLGRNWREGREGRDGCGSRSGFMLSCRGRNDRDSRLEITTRDFPKVIREVEE